MNELTKFGPVREIAELALSAIYKLSALGLSEKELHKYEDLWLSLVSTPGGSHFSSRSSLSSEEEE